MSVSKSRFTVAKLDAGMAILLTSDHHLIEFPSLLLPSGVVAGSIIDLSVAQNSSKEKEEQDKFIALQKDIQNLFAVHPPSTPELHVRNTTQTSVVLEWDLLDLATADLRSLSLYKNGSKLGKIPNATTTTTKLSGLALDTEYTFQLILRTSAGVYKSNELIVRTHKMTNLTGLNVCLAHLKPEDNERLIASLKRIGAKPPHNKVRIDTTHFVTDRGTGEEYKKAQSLNIPIVIPEFVEACEAEGRLMRVGSYYLDSDPALRSKRVAPISAPAPLSESNAEPASAPAGSATQSATQVSTSTSADVATMLPKQSTPLTEDTSETTDKTTEGSSTGEAVTAAIAATASQVQSIAETGLEKVVGLVQGEQGSSGTKEGDDGSALSPAEAAPAVSSKDEADGEKSNKLEVEPHPEATAAVEDLPSQLDTNNNESFPPSMGRTNGEDMEDVAL